MCETCAACASPELMAADPASTTRAARRRIIELERYDPRFRITFGQTPMPRPRPSSPSSPVCRRQSRSRAPARSSDSGPLVAMRRRSSRRRFAAKRDARWWLPIHLGFPFWPSSRTARCIHPGGISPYLPSALYWSIDELPHWVPLYLKPAQPQRQWRYCRSNRRGCSMSAPAPASLLRPARQRVPTAASRESSWPRRTWAIDACCATVLNIDWRCWRPVRPDWSVA